MKTKFALLPILLASLFLPPIAHAAITDPGKPAQIAPEGTAARKIQRGFLNIALSPIEISHELDKEKKNRTWIPSWIFGMGRGVAYASVRAVVGAFEILNFWRPSESRIDPEFAWDHLEKSKEV